MPTLLAHLPCEGFVVRFRRTRTLQPHAVHDRVDEMEPVPFGDLLGLQDRVAGEGVHGFMRFDPSEPRVLVPEIAEAGDQHPLERVLPVIVELPPFILQRLQPLLLFLIDPPFAHHGPQRGRNDPLALLADRVAQFRHRRVLAAPAVDGLGRDVVRDHDRGIHRHEIQLRHLLVIPHLGLEDQSAPVGKQQDVRRFEVLRLALVRRDQIAVAVGPGELHAGECGADGGTRLVLHGKLGEARDLRHAVQTRFAHHEGVLDVQVPPSGKFKGTVLVDDLAIGEVAGGVRCDVAARRYRG